MVGGALRLVDAYLATTGAVQAQQITYFVTDLMLALGLLGIYLPRRKILGVVGLLGFVAALAGLLVVRAAVLNGFGPNAYLIGATVTLVGVVAMSAALLARTSFPKLAPFLWMASFAVGLVGLLSAKLAWAIALAGILFGVGFIVAGIHLLQSRHETRSDSQVATGPGL